MGALLRKLPALHDQQPPVFTVVIPHLDRPRMLARAVQSVIDQDCPGWQLVVVDDGSSAANLAQVREIVAHTPRTKLLTNGSRSGAPASRNRGIAAASGRYIAFLDSDDWWSPSHLSSHLDRLAASSLHFTYNSAELVEPGGGRRPVRQGAAASRRTPSRVEILGRNFIGGCSSVCVSKDLLGRIGGFREDLQSCQDWDLWIRALQVTEPGFVADCSTFQDVSGNDRITTNRAKVSSGHRAIRELAASLALTAGERRSVDAHFLEVRAELAARFGDHGKALALSALSFARSADLRKLKRCGDHLWHLAHR